MTTLSINLPDKLAHESQEIAGELGLSRTEFIRQAIIHELEDYRTKREQEAIAKSMLAMKHSSEYLAESEELLSGFSSDLPDDEEEGWWSKKS